MIEDREKYIQKIHMQIGKDYEQITEREEEEVVLETQQEISRQLRKMGLKKIGERRNFMMTSPSMAHMYALIKVHKIDHPGRAVVSQIDDPSYKLCHKLTRILAPISAKSSSFIQDS